MKKQDSSIKAQIIRSAFILLSLVAVCAIPFALAQRNGARRSAAKPNPALFSAQSHLSGGCAQTMYGGNGNGGTNPGALVIINQTNGTGTLVGTPVSGVGLSGIAFHQEGRLFASPIAGV